MQFSDCGRYIFGISTQWPGAVFQFDVRERFTLRTIYDPFNCGFALDSMSISLYNGEVFVLAIDSTTIVAARLPLSGTARYEFAPIALGPSALLQCTSLRLLWPSTSDGDIVIIAQGKNQLRKTGKIGGNVQWPIVMAVKERDIGEWRPLVERKLSTNEPHEQNESAKAGSDELDEDGRQKNLPKLRNYGEKSYIVSLISGLTITKRGNRPHF